MPARRAHPAQDRLDDVVAVHQPVHRLAHARRGEGVEFACPGEDRPGGVEGQLVVRAVGDVAFQGGGIGDLLGDIRIAGAPGVDVESAAFEAGDSVPGRGLFHHQDGVRGEEIDHGLGAVGGAVGGAVARHVRPVDQRLRRRRVGRDPDDDMGGKGRLGSECAHVPHQRIGRAIRGRRGGDEGHAGGQRVGQHDVGDVACPPGGDDDGIRDRLSGLHDGVGGLLADVQSHVDDLVGAHVVPAVHGPGVALEIVIGRANRRAVGRASIDARRPGLQVIVAADRVRETGIDVQVALAGPAARDVGVGDGDGVHTPALDALALVVIVDNAVDDFQGLGGRGVEENAAVVSGDGHVHQLAAIVVMQSPIACVAGDEDVGHLQFAAGADAARAAPVDAIVHDAAVLDLNRQVVSPGGHAAAGPVPRVLIGGVVVDRAIADGDAGVLDIDAARSPGVAAGDRQPVQRRAACRALERRHRLAPLARRAGVQRGVGNVRRPVDAVERLGVIDLSRVSLVAPHVVPHLERLVFVDDVRIAYRIRLRKRRPGSETVPIDAVRAGDHADGRMLFRTTRVPHPVRCAKLEHAGSPQAVLLPRTGLGQQRWPILVPSDAVGRGGVGDDGALVADGVVPQFVRPAVVEHGTVGGALLIVALGTGLEHRVAGVLLPTDAVVAGGVI